MSFPWTDQSKQSKTLTLEMPEETHDNFQQVANKGKQRSIARLFSVAVAVFDTVYTAYLNGSTIIIRDPVGHERELDLSDLDF